LPIRFIRFVKSCKTISKSDLRRMLGAGRAFPGEVDAGSSTENAIAKSAIEQIPIRFRADFAGLPRRRNFEALGTGA